MPKPRAEREVSNDGTTLVLEIEAAAGGGTKDHKTVQYSVPANAAKFQEMILGLGTSPDNGTFVKSILGPDRNDQNESPLDFAYRMWKSQIDRTARMQAYEAAAQESTIITVGKDKIDIYEFPKERLVQAINGMRGHRASQLLMLGVVDPDAPESENTVKGVDRKINYNQFQTAGRRLVEAGTAKENAASGMLELVA